MKKVFLGIIAVAGFELFGMEKTVYFSTVHESIPQIKAKVSNGLKLLDSSFNKVDELSVPSEGEEDVLEVSMSDTVNSGIVSIHSSDNDRMLLKFQIEKNTNYSPANVKFLTVGSNTKAVLYRPSMGGGDNFVLAIGNNETDISVTRMQQSLPFGSIQFFFQVCEMEKR